MMPSFETICHCSYFLARDVLLSVGLLFLCREVRRVSDTIHELMIHSSYDAAKIRERLSLVDRSLNRTVRRLSDLMAVAAEEN